MDGDGPRFGAMIGLVAVVVATVILVFFGSRLRARAALSVDGASTLAPFNGPDCLVRHRKQRAGAGRQPAAAVPRGDLAGAGLLDLQRRPPPDRRSDAGGVRHRGLAVPVHRDDRLPDRAPAGVPRRRARARARDRRRAGPARQPRAPALPVLRVRDREGRSCAARAACGGSRSRAPSAASRSTRAGRSAPTARPRWARRPRARRPPRRARPRAGGAAARRGQASPAGRPAPGRGRADAPRSSGPRRRTVAPSQPARWTAPSSW